MDVPSSTWSPAESALNYTLSLTFRVMSAGQETGNGNNDATILADFRGRVVNIRATVNKAAFGVSNGADLNNHGTHVCGSILGNVAFCADAAVAVGGTLLLGGQAYLIGTLVGALIIQLVRYTLLANGVPDAAALVVKAGIIVGAVFLQRRGGAQ